MCCEHANDFYSNTAYRLNLFNHFSLNLIGADWGGGMSACCKPQVQLLGDAGNGWPHSALRYH